MRGWEARTGTAKDKMLFRLGRRRQLLELPKSFSQNQWYPLEMVEILSY